MSDGGFLIDCSSVNHSHAESTDWMYNEFREYCQVINKQRTSHVKALNHTELEQICENEALNDTDLLMLFSLTVMVGYGALVRTLLQIFKLNIPYTVVLMLSGVGIGLLSKTYCDQLHHYTAIARIPPEIILNAFLPVLIFESAFSITPHTFFRCLGQILVLALIGMAISTFITGFAVKYFMDAYHWNFLQSFLFGSIISATDPVAVVAILRELGTSEVLSTLIEGESLLNDGAAIMFYEIFWDIGTCETSLAATPLYVFKKLFSIAFGAPLFGFFVGKLTVWCLSVIFNDATVEITITLVSAYLTYYIAENLLHISGVVAVVVLGVTMGSERTSISPEVEVFVHHFWQMLGYLANTVLFCIVGIVISESALINIALIDWLYLIFLYLALNLIRFGMLFLLYPIVSRIGYGLTWQSLVIIMWGGLRGAIGICLALRIELEVATCHTNIGPKYLFHTAGVVLLTIAINGTTTKYLLKALKLTEISQGRYQDMANAMKQLENAQSRTITVLKYDRFVADANWTIVNKYTTFPNPYSNKDLAEQRKVADSGSLISIQAEYDQRRLECPDCHATVPNEPNYNEYTELTEEARLRVLKALKVSFWRQFEQGVLIEVAVLYLVNITAAAEDVYLKLVRANDLRRFWSVHGCLPWTKTKLDSWLGSEDYNPQYPPKPSNPIRAICWWISVQPWLELVMIVIIAVDMIPLIAELYFIMAKNKYAHETPVVFAFNMLFFLIYVLEFLIKIIGLGPRSYFCDNNLNWVDVLIIFLCSIDKTMVIGEAYGFWEQTNTQRTILTFIQFAKCVRIIRLFRTLKILKPKVMIYLDKKINAQLYLGYDVAKGFVTAIDDVIKYMPIMIEHPRIAAKLRKALIKERLETVREMGIMQKDHPEIAMAVKTRHASRVVLNQMKATLIELKEDGLVDDNECNLLLQNLEESMKKLWKTPPSIPPPPPQFLLANVSWIVGCVDILDYFLERAELVSFEYGETICKTGDRSFGIFLLISGMVKIRFVPTEQLLKALEQDGDLPNTEVNIDVSFRYKEEDFYSAGTVIGEYGVLTDSLRDASVQCETSIIAYYIRLEDMQAALVRFADPYDSLESRMWRAVGMKVAIPVLAKTSAYVAWGADKIRMFVERSCVPIGPDFEVVKVEDFVAEVVVIEGKVEDVLSKKVFVAPALLPAATYKFKKIHTNVIKTVVLVIANENFVAGTMGRSGGSGTETPLKLCMIKAIENLQHKDSIQLKDGDHKRFRNRRVGSFHPSHPSNE